MSLSITLLMVLLAMLGYLVAPITIILGWLRFAKMEKPTRVFPLLTLGAFILSTASALLAFGSAIYARFHYFPYYDPLLMKVFRTGFLLSLGGLFLAMLGIWRPSSLRWHAPTSAVATAAFWLMAAAGE